MPFGKQKSGETVVPQRISGFLEFATLLQQRHPKSPEITTNYVKYKGANRFEDGQEKSLKALRL